MMDEVKHTLRPEFINRIDEIIVFHPLTAIDQKEVEDPISELILQEGLEKKKVLHMDAKDGKLTFHAE